MAQIKPLYPEGTTLIFYKNYLRKNEFDNAKFANNIKFIFTNCNIIDGISLEANNCTFIFKNNKKGNGIGILKIKSENPNNIVIIKDSEFSNLTFSDIKLKTLDFNNVTLDSLVIENYSQIKSLTYKAQHLNKNYNIEKVILRDSVINSISYFKLYKCKYFNISGAVIENMKILHSNIEKFDFYDYLTNDLKILFGEIDDLNIDIIEEDIYDHSRKNKFNSLILNSKVLKSFKINSDERINKFDNIQITSEKINITNINTRQLTIKNQVVYESKVANSEIEILELMNFYSVKKFRFDNVNISKPAECLTIRNSSLNNVSLNPFFLHNFNEIKFTNSSLLNLEANNLTKIPINAIKPIYRDKETNYLILYRELKSIAQKYGDTYLYHKFKALEYNERLNGSLDFLDKSILYFNKFTNNHTTDWFKAFKLLIILFTFNLSIITSYLYNSYENFNVLDIAKLLPYLLSPVSFLVNYKEYEFHNVIYLFDFLYNIGIGLIIYQMIAAFRKFNR
ncbi:hypothetical protein Q4534_06735 [Cyclobacterium sp. 1_MG-2023]|uniref:hypothetical protein n=1 Tax=Cyclobacterium sp. 1_MG-2023 TaxID=3062681 RepID=UPI0026E26AA4|nr:hypothetical protein [Cyclobacterium sp. 1_MG-2023]MDO6437093.1 hypothetical protein [Cyclobacterium sp. 1_MG-2023]